MNIYVNSKLQDIREKTTIHEMLLSMDITAHGGLAVAVNNSIIPYAAWKNRELQPDDNIILIRATQGG
jgi:sulfur carrier protein